MALFAAFRYSMISGSPGARGTHGGFPFGEKVIDEG
jgi:hypothetical protein